MIQNGEEFSVKLEKILPPVMPALNASMNHEILVFCPLKAHSGVAAMECSCGHYRHQTIVQHLVGPDNRLGRNSVLLGLYLLSAPSGGISRPAFIHYVWTRVRTGNDKVWGRNYFPEGCDLQQHLQQSMLQGKMDERQFVKSRPR